MSISPPNGEATNAIVTELNNAKTEILVQAYSFTIAPIAKALIEAKNRGFKIEVVLDKSQRSEKYSSEDFIAHDWIPVYIDSKHAISHNKIMIIDRNTRITGLFNFIKSAEEKNAENLMILKGNSLWCKGKLRTMNCTRGIGRGMLEDRAWMEIMSVFLSTIMDSGSFRVTAKYCNPFFFHRQFIPTFNPVTVSCCQRIEYVRFW